MKIQHLLENFDQLGEIVEYSGMIGLEIHEIADPNLLYDLNRELLEALPLASFDDFKEMRERGFYEFYQESISNLKMTMRRMNQIINIVNQYRDSVVNDIWVELYKQDEEGQWIDLSVNDPKMVSTFLAQGGRTEEDLKKITGGT
jgi:hypothetical protein